jgi:hypothetical protein
LTSQRIGFKSDGKFGKNRKSYYKFDYYENNNKGYLRVSDLLYNTNRTSITVNANGKTTTYTVQSDNTISPLNPDLTVSSDGKIVLGRNVIKFKYDSGPESYQKLTYHMSNIITSSANLSCYTAKQNRALCDNKAYADKLIALTTTHPGASERYDNIRGFTNMSILNIFNLGIGIVAAGVFIAQTYK